MCSVNHGRRGIWSQSIVKADCQEELRTELSCVSICIPLLEYLNPEHVRAEPVFWSEPISFGLWQLSSHASRKWPPLLLHLLHLFVYRKELSGSMDKILYTKKDCWQCGKTASMFASLRAKATTRPLFDHQWVSYHTTLTLVTHFWTAHCIFHTHDSTSTLTQLQN